METIEERTLLNENADAIDTVRATAQFNASALNRLHELLPITTEQEARAAVQDKAYIVRQMMEQHHKKFLTVVNDVMTLKMPDHIRQVKDAIENVAARMNKDSRTPGVFPFVKFDGETWRVDVTALEDYCDRRFRKYADSERQQTILKFATGLADLLNTFPLGENARRRNFEDNEFVTFDRKNAKWVPNIGTVIRAEVEEVFKY